MPPAAMLVSRMDIRFLERLHPKHWDARGHLKRKYASLRRVHAREQPSDPDPRAFLKETEHRMHAPQEGLSTGAPRDDASEQEDDAAFRRVFDVEDEGADRENS